MVELGATDRVFGNPVHPYTKSLLASVPQLHVRWSDLPRPAENGGPDGGTLVEVEADHYAAAATR